MVFSIRTILQSVCVIFILVNVIDSASKKYPKKESRIVGGTDATINRVNYIVQIRDEGDTHCGGTLIASKYVITAAHCVDGVKKSDLSVVAGATSRKAAGISRKVDTVTVHENYKRNSSHSDVAILKLKKSFSVTEARPIGLCKATPAARKFIQTSGWGAISEKPYVYPDGLKTVRLTVTNQTACEEEFGKKVRRNTFCGFSAEMKGACTGDSGGPGVVNGQLCGVIAYTGKCGNDMTAYTSVARVRSFIDSAMGSDALPK